MSALPLSYPSDRQELLSILDDVSSKLISLDSDLQHISKTQEEFDTRRAPLQALFSELHFLQQQLIVLDPTSPDIFISINIGRPVLALKDKVDNFYGSSLPLVFPDTSIKSFPAVGWSLVIVSAFALFIYLRKVKTKDERVIP